MQPRAILSQCPVRSTRNKSGLVGQHPRHDRRVLTKDLRGCCVDRPEELSSPGMIDVKVEVVLIESRFIRNSWECILCSQERDIVMSRHHVVLDFCSVDPLQPTNIPSGVLNRACWVHIACGAMWQDGGNRSELGNLNPHLTQDSWRRRRW